MHEIPRAGVHRLARCGALAVFALVCASAPADAGGGNQLQFDGWTTENGLPQNSVTDILQTRDGYLWLATYGGLVRFDGVRFTVFDRGVDGIGSQRVRVLHEDRHGALWAATDDGMLIRYRDSRFITYTTADGLPHATALRIEEDDEGRLWITWTGAISSFDGKRFQTFGPEHFAGVTVPAGERVTDVWWSPDPEGIRALVKGRVRTFAVASELNGAQVSRVRTDRCGNLWITTSDAGLIKAAPDRVERHSKPEGLRVANRNGLFLADCSNNVWFQDSRETVYRVRNGEPELTDLPSILAVYQDREGSVWVGTNVAGLRRVRHTAFTTLSAGDGLPLENVYSILQDRAGALWIGTWGAGLARYADGRFRLYDLADGLPSIRICSTYQDRSGRLWVGTTAGLSSFHNGRFRRVEDPAGFLHGQIWAIHEDRSGVFWFATDAGLVRSSAGRLTRFTVKDGLSHDHTSALFEDRAGTLWIGTYRGLTRLKSGAFTAYTDRDGFIGNAVRAFHEDDAGVLWIGTYDGGLYRLAHDRLTRYTRNEGLYDNGVFQILEDDAGNLWTGSNRGISRVSRRELNEFAEGRRSSLTPVVFSAKDGLTNAEVNGGRQPAGIKARDGKLWFPTMGGAAVIDPTVLRTSAPPLVILEEFRVSGAPADLGEQIRIPPDAATFEVRYTAPSFVKPEQVRFRYRLAGLDNQWIDAGDRRTATFFRIPPGRYRLEVIAASHDGHWGTSGASLDILVLAPFWRTSWFGALALAGCGSLAFAGHQVRVRRLRRLRELHEAFSQQLIDSQERERKRVSNEMHDSLGQDLGIIKKLTRSQHEKRGDREAVAATLDEIGAIAERMDAEMKDIAYDLRPYQLDTIGLTKTIESMVRRVGKACDVEFMVDISPIDHCFPKSAHVHMFRIVQEAVNNVVKHSGASHARAVVATRAASVEIAVEDNGIGFSPEVLEAARSIRNGFGLVGIRERARILGGRVDIQSSAQTGTVVTVTLPLASAAHD